MVEKKFELKIRTDWEICARDIRNFLKNCDSFWENLHIKALQVTDAK